MSGRVFGLGRRAWGGEAEMDISYGIAKGSTNRPCGALPNPCVLLGVLDHDDLNGLAQLRGGRRQGRKEGIEKNVTFLRRMLERKLSNIYR